MVEQVGEKTFLFRGLDGTPDKKLIAEQKPQAVTFFSKDMPQSEASFSWLVKDTGGQVSNIILPKVFGRVSRRAGNYNGRVALFYDHWNRPRDS